MATESKITGEKYANPLRKAARILSMIVGLGEKMSGPGGRFLLRLTD